MGKFTDFLTRIGIGNKSGMISRNLNIDNSQAYYYDIKTDLDSLREAVNRATSYQFSTTNELQTIYNSISADDAVRIGLNLRVNEILDKKYGIYHEGKEKHTNLSKRVCENSWFKDVVRHAWESIMYGYSVLYFHRSETTGEIESVENIDRRNIIPFTHQGPIITENRYTASGKPVSNFPEEMLFVALDKWQNQVGLLQTVALKAIRKRGLENIEDYGHKRSSLPLYALTTDNPNILASGTQTEKKARESLRRLPKAGSAILPHETKIQIVESSHAGAVPLRATIKAHEESILKLLIGSSTIVNEGANRSQTEVHERVAEHIYARDCSAILDWLNGDFKNYITNYVGVEIPDDHSFGMDTKPDPNAQKEIDFELLRLGIKIDPQMLKDRYNIEIDTSSNLPTPQDIAKAVNGNGKRTKPTNNAVRQPR